MKLLVPTVKLDNKESILPVRAISPPMIVVRIQDLLTKKRVQLNELFYKIKRAAGIHSFLKYNGKIILSTIMKDYLLKKINAPIYFDILEGLKPDYYITIDCETYDNESEYSKKQLKEACLKTMELIKLFPEICPIGLIKGSNRKQILGHHNFLKRLGINIFILHAGDFFRHGDNKQIQKLKNYANLIKKKDNILFLYGFGSQKRIDEFSFVDGYITYSHMVNAQNGIIFNQKKKQRNTKMSYHKAGIYNLKQMLLNLTEIKNQTKLNKYITQWGEELEYKELIIQRQ